MHQHFDMDDKPTGYTVITRESLWDDAARARAMALVEYEDSIDPNTRLPVDEAYTQQGFVVDHQINYAEIAVENHKKTVKKEAIQAAKGAAGKLADGWDLGFHYFVRPATAAEQEEAGGGD